jgi:hypothetical protein
VHGYRIEFGDNTLLLRDRCYRNWLGLYDFLTDVGLRTTLTEPNEMRFLRFDVTQNESRIDAKCRLKERNSLIRGDRVRG